MFLAPLLVAARQIPAMLSTAVVTRRHRLCELWRLRHCTGR